MSTIAKVMFACVALAVSVSVQAGTGSLQRTSSMTKAKVVDQSDPAALRGATGPLGTVGPASEQPAPKRSSAPHR